MLPMDGMVYLKQRVGLAAHTPVTEQRADDDRRLHFRQTSHGITQSCSAVRTALRRWASPLLADARPAFLRGPPHMLRCQTLPSMWTLGKNKPVIPGVPFIR